MTSIRDGIIALLLAMQFASCGDDDDDASPEPQVTSHAEEFRTIARSIYSSTNEYFGGAPAETLRKRLAFPGLGMEERVETELKLCDELLKFGKIDEAKTIIEKTIEWTARLPIADLTKRIHKLRGLIYLREAERRNCIERHNQECCIFPLQGGGVHSVREPAVEARRSYLRHLEIEPLDLGARWLLNITYMALGEYPDGVPREHFIPSSRTPLDPRFSRFPDVAPRLGLDTFNLCGGCIVDDFEAADLTERDVSTAKGAEDAARAIVEELGAEAVLVKGGHRDGAPDDLLARAGDSGLELTWLPGVHIDAGPVHGTGCALSAAITAGLALGRDLEASVADARAMVGAGLERAQAPGGGARFLGLP